MVQYVILRLLFNQTLSQIVGIQGIVGDDEDVADFAAMTVIQTAVRALGTVDSINETSRIVTRGGPETSTTRCDCLISNYILKSKAVFFSNFFYDLNTYIMKHCVAKYQELDGIRSSLNNFLVP